MLARGNDLSRRSKAGDPTAVRGRKMAGRTCFASEKQATVNRRG
jgi:hypothetical protein